MSIIDIPYFAPFLKQLGYTNVVNNGYSGHETSLEEMLSFYNRKYEDGSEFLVIKGLSYFDDADIQPAPKMLVNFDWDQCRDKILSLVRKL